MKEDYIIYDELGNIYEYNPRNGLISKNDVIVSGEQYEPVFSRYLDNSEPPVFTGIYLRFQNKFLGKSGKANSIIDFKTIG